MATVKARSKSRKRPVKQAKKITSKIDLRNVIENVVDKVRSNGLYDVALHNRIIREARTNLEELSSRINDVEWITRARSAASNTKDQVFTILSIPSQDDVTKIKKKKTIILI